MKMHDSRKYSSPQLQQASQKLGGCDGEQMRGINFDARQTLDIEWQRSPIKKRFEDALQANFLSQEAYTRLSHLAAAAEAEGDHIMTLNDFETASWGSFKTMSSDDDEDEESSGPRHGDFDDFRTISRTLRQSSDTVDTPTLGHCRQSGPSSWTRGTGRAPTLPRSGPRSQTAG
jgi:hypothetical protein